MSNDVFHQDFVKKNVDPRYLNYVLDQIKEVHTEDAGWVVGDPKDIINNPDGTITFTVPLDKYPVEKSQERSL